MKTDAQRRGFDPSQRLCTTGLIDTVREAGHACECGPFRVQWRFRGAEETVPASLRPRFAVIASRRVGGAVVRNRCKRRLRELFRLHQNDLPPACDVVIIARHRLTRLSWPESVRAYERALGHIQRAAANAGQGAS